MTLPYAAVPESVLGMANMSFSEWTADEKSVDTKDAKIWELFCAFRGGSELSPEKKEKYWNRYKLLKCSLIDLLFKDEISETGIFFNLYKSNPSAVKEMAVNKVETLLLDFFNKYHFDKKGVFTSSNVKYKYRHLLHCEGDEQTNKLCLLMLNNCFDEQDKKYKLSKSYIVLMPHNLCIRSLRKENFSTKAIQSNSYMQALLEDNSFVVPLKQNVICDEKIFQLYDYYEAGDLFENIHKLTPLMKWNLADGLLKFLVALDSKKIIHRDLSLNNIVLKRSGELGVIDFEFACVENNYGNAERLCGTPGYIPPEIWFCAASKERRLSEFLSTKNDVWSFGMIFWQLFEDEIPSILWTWAQRSYDIKSIEHAMKFFNIETDTYERILPNCEKSGPLAVLLFHLLHPVLSKRWDSKEAIAYWQEHIPPPQN